MIFYYFNSLKSNWLLKISFSLLVFLFSCSKDGETFSSPLTTAPLTGTPDITTTTILNNQGIIWGFDFLPNGNILFTQKTGTMRLFDTTTLTIH